MIFEILLLLLLLLPVLLLMLLLRLLMNVLAYWGNISSITVAAAIVDGIVVIAVIHGGSWLAVIKAVFSTQ